MSKKVKDNLDAGLWVSYCDDYVAAVYQDTDSGQFVITYHKEAMPAFNSESFNSFEELITAMREIESDLRKWRIRTI